MRILRFLISALIFFGLVGVGGFLIARESLLVWGTSSLEHSLKELRDASTSNTFVSECGRRGGNEGLSEFEDQVRYQLRFLNSREFVLEAVCSQFPLNPIVIKRSTLPKFITKSVGSSGFFWADGEDNSIELKVFGELEQEIQKYAKFDTSFLIRKKYIVIQDSLITVQSEPGPTAVGPVTSCQGYGYQCCEASSQMGIGDQLTNTIGCSDSCFSSCVGRPFLLSFNSNPFFDPRTRIVTLESTGTVEFQYIADSADSDEMSGILYFGDGQQIQIIGKQGHVNHTYSCPQGNCAYTAKVSLIDKWGVESADTPISQIEVKFTN